MVIILLIPFFFTWYLYSFSKGYNSTDFTI